MRSITCLKLFLPVGACILALATIAAARAAPPAAPPSATTAVPSPTPQQTTATFADWTLHCEHFPAVGESCEVVEMVASQGRTVAQIAMGRLGHSEPVHLTLLVPPNVTLAQPPRLVGPEKAPPVMELTWRRGLPGGCLAEAALPVDLLRQIRTRSDAMRMTFLDGIGKETSVPLSPQGLGQALDALAHEDGL